MMFEQVEEKAYCTVFGGQTIPSFVFGISYQPGPSGILPPSPPTEIRGAVVGLGGSLLGAGACIADSFAAGEVSDAAGAELDGSTLDSAAAGTSLVDFTGSTTSATAPGASSSGSSA